MEHLPLWFLLLSLVVPRICLVAAYFLHDLVAYHLNGWVPPMLGVIVPRALVLIVIFQDRGMSAWLLIHAVVMACVYLSAGKKSKS